MTLRLILMSILILLLATNGVSFLQHNSHISILTYNRKRTQIISHQKHVFYIYSFNPYSRKISKSSPPRFLSSSKDPDLSPDVESTTASGSRRSKIRSKVKRLSEKLGLGIATVPSSPVGPQVIAAVLRDAAEGTAEKFVSPVLQKARGKNDVLMEIDSLRKRTKAAFVSARSSLSLANKALDEAEQKATEALELVEAEIAEIEEATPIPYEGKVERVPRDPSTLTDISDLSYEDIDFSFSEMAPPFIGEDQCLVPGVPVVRVEKAPENSRRIFAGIDIFASVDDVWKVLTNYEHLQDVVPNLVVNEVLEQYEASSIQLDNSTLPEEDSCAVVAMSKKGAKLRQVGGAKVIGINFSARTTLDVREWPEGLPNSFHFEEETYEGKSRTKRASEGKNLKLVRYRFPRPFAISLLPTKDISMQSVLDDDGEFRMYQGVWRMQPLPGCAPPGESAMRLTYAVEVSPRPYLPVSLVERRIANDLCANLEKIREYVENMH